ncbi:hypothetical protein GH714_021035 [Hevea brasiliensis]|uniref:Uncharacterized protein n=1 Tax=Hevea brasiliensis TaxID=3981 RepID=A0A6A6N702_HEVBR|nr:hypothetical protein GH714_021035 [Hevea brasiliensis]
MAFAIVVHGEHVQDCVPKVDRWKRALMEVSKVAGWDSRNIMPESKLVEEIVNDVLKKFSGMFSSDDSYDRNLVGIESRVKKVEQLLNDKTVVGLWGMAGIGKTTIAQEVFRRNMMKFDGHCFLDKHLGNLVLLKLVGSKDLIRIPDLPKTAPNVEVLDLSWCHSLTEIPSLQNLSKLTQLRVTVKGQRGSGGNSKEKLVEEKKGPGSVSSVSVKVKEEKLKPEHLPCRDTKSTSLHLSGFCTSSWIREMQQASDKPIIISENLDARTRNLVSVSRISQMNWGHQRDEIVIGYRLANAYLAIINPSEKSKPRKWSLDDVFIVISLVVLEKERRKKLTDSGLDIRGL